MDLDDVVDELYGLDPSEFTARRDALAATARTEGDRSLASAIRALRRPSAAAHTVNLMARERSSEIEGLIVLGDRFREAQAALSGDELRALGRQRQQLVAGLVHEARRVARDAGRPVSEATGREVESTFEAALGDPAAGEALRRGRLVRALQRTGLDAVDLEGAVAGSMSGGSGDRGRRGPGKAGDRAERSAEAEAEATQAEQREQAARAAEQAAAQAEQAAAQAETELGQAVAAEEAAELRRIEADEQVRLIEGQLSEARAAADQAAETARTARRARQDAEEKADAAHSEAGRSPRRAEGLRR